MENYIRILYYCNVDNKTEMKNTVHTGSDTNEKSVQGQKISPSNYIFIYNIYILSAVFRMTYLMLYNSHINITRDDIKFYIKSADDASKGKLQVNWHNLAAIDAVRCNNDFSKVDSKKTKELADIFIAVNKTNTKVKKSKYSLKSIEEVLDKLNFKNQERKKVFEYLYELKYIGLTSKKLNEYPSKISFINEITPQAIKIYDKYDILPSITISQAVLESNWGQSTLALKFNNLFGIKADSSWKGSRITMDTSEYYDKTVSANFRAYKSITESINDYGSFIYENKRYTRNGIFSAT